MRHGAICYLDEVVEARKDTIVLIHPLTDHRRILPIDKTGEMLEAHPDFLLVISYNPGYQSVMKDLKHSTRQRFVALEFDYPPRDKEARSSRTRASSISTRRCASPRWARRSAICGRAACRRASARGSSSTPAS